jgi:NAD(P)-dependent dehydrogenase (short-subunit alcohol dehydrogenase family)
MGRKSLAISAHNAKMDELNNLVQKVQDEFGRIDILVNNAAANPVLCSVLEMEEPPFDMIMNVNIKGYFFLSQAAAKMMQKQGGGVIINISSVGGLSPDPGLAAYCMSKAAIIMMTEAMALELGKHNIRVNAIAPGIVRTRFSQALWSNPDILNPELEKMPLKRVAEPEEIARTALHLASDASSFMTGHTVVLDGGANL